MPALSDARYEARKEYLMERSYECFADKGLHGTGIRAIGDYCDCNPAILYTYFRNLDDLIIQSTAHCMAKVEDDFMEKAPTNAAELDKFIDEIPYWTAEKHGKKYRLMYQIYTHPKYREHGQAFFKGVDQRYAEYAKFLEGQLGIPSETLTPLIFILIRACVHYALFEDEVYLQAQVRVLKQAIQLFYKEYNQPKA